MTETNYLSVDMDALLSGGTHTLSVDMDALLAKTGQTLTVDLDAKLVETLSVDMDALIVDPQGTFRGTLTTAERDALPALQAQDTVLNMDATTAPSGVNVTQAQYWTGSAWLSGNTMQSPTSGVTSLFVVPTTAGWRVEEGDPSYPLRYWNGSTTNFSVDDAGDVFMAGNLSAGSIDIPDAASPGFHVSSVGVVDIDSSDAGQFHVNPAAGADVRLTQYARMATVTGRRAEGTSGSPTAVAADSTGLQLDFRGYTGSAFTSSGKASVTLLAAETWSATANGTYIQFKTTKNTTTTANEVLRLKNDGGIQAPNITTPATPPSGSTLGYFSSSDKKLHVIDDTGADTALGSGGGTTLANDTLWAATGDLVYATGNDAATVLTANSTATNKYLRSVSSGAPSWQQVPYTDISGTPTFVTYAKWSLE